MTDLTEQTHTSQIEQSSNHDDLTIERVDNLTDLASFEDDWHRLLAGNQTRTTELTYEWNTDYWKYISKKSQLFVLIVKRQAEVIAIAPLSLNKTRKFGIPIRELKFIAAGESNFQDFIIGEQHLKVLQCIEDYLSQHRKLWDIFYLTHVPETSTTVEFLLKQNKEHFVYYVAAIEACLYALTDISWDEHLKNHAQSSQRQFRERMRRLRKIGEVEAFRCDNAEDLKIYLDTFFAMHRKRWGDTDTPSQFEDERYRNFYQDVSQKLFEKGQIDIYGLKLDGEIIAIQYAFFYDEIMVGQWQTYDIEYHKVAPGLVMIQMYLEDLFNSDRIGIIEFGMVADYKGFWGDQLKNRYNIEIYTKRLLPLSVLALAQTKEYLKSIKPLQQFVKNTKTRLYFMRKRLLNR